MESGESRLEAFLARINKRPLPDTSLARIKTLAKELAEGAAEELWNTFIPFEIDNFTDPESRRYIPYSDRMNRYLAERWGDNYPNLALLERSGYLEMIEQHFEMMPSAFQLLTEAPPASIFISYKRSESSEFALLVLARLKAEGLDAYLDLLLVPGEDWHAGIKERIQQYDYFVVLLGRETLNSEVVRKEILWALEAKLTMIPIWHHGFTYASGAWDVPEHIDRVLSNTHTVRVLEESAMGYNNAIVELLNRFGVTP